MGYSEHEKERIEYTFHAFCKTVLRNETINAYRELQRKQKHEVPLDYLLSETLFVPSTTDTYFEEYDEPTAFSVKGQTVLIASKQLANALCKLSEQRRTVLLMYFFLGYTDEKIGMEYGRSRSTVNYWKLAALKQLRKEKLMPFEIIERAVAGEADAIDTVLRHYIPQMKYLSKYQGHINDEIQDRLKAKLMNAVLQFQFDH